MRFRTITMCAVFVAASLLASTAAMADECYAGKFKVETTGPVYPGDCGAEPCTEITYKVSGGKPDHVATVVASAYTDCETESILSVSGEQITGNQSYPPAVGDPITGLGKLACHEEAAKVNPNDTVSEFTIRVEGIRSPAAKSVVTKKGGKVGSCEIVGLGDLFTGDASPIAEFLCHGECCVEILLDRNTGAVLSVAEAAGNPTDCTFTDFDVGQLEIVIGGNSYGLANVATGYVESLNPANGNSFSFTNDGSGYSKATGGQNCLTTFSYGKLYTICYPR